MAKATSTKKSAKKATKKVAKRRAKKRPKAISLQLDPSDNEDGYVAIDVTPQALLNAGEHPYLGELLKEIDKQWSRRRTRIGTVYVYFDSDDVLHMHFIERGSYLKRKGALAKIPKGKSPEFLT